MVLDFRDKKLLQELSLNSRMPIRKLARKLKISKSTVNYRIKRLKDRGIITGFKTYLDYSKLGIVEYVLYLKFQKMTKKTEEEIIEFFKSNKNVSWLGNSYGNWELIIEFRAENFEKIYSVLSRFYKRYSKYILKKELVKNISENFFGYKFEKTKKNELLNINFIGKKEKLYETEKRIIKYLIENPNYNLYKIAADLSISLDSTRNKIKKLQQKSIIKGYSAQINFSSFGFGQHIILISVHSINEKKWLDFLREHEKIYYLYKYLGRWDYEVGIYTQNNKEFEKIIEEMKSKFPEIDYEFCLITKLHKSK